MEEKLADWRDNHTLSFATDLVGTALLFDEVPDEARSAASLILSSNSSTTTARMLARRVLHPDALLQEASETDVSAGITGTSRHRSAKIGQLRRGLRDAPRNPLAWADLSFEYAAAGLRDKAVAAMEMALKLAPFASDPARFGSYIAGVVLKGVLGIPSSC